jgi:hypothetical protein
MFSCSSSSSMVFHDKEICREENRLILIKNKFSCLMKIILDNFNCHIYEREESTRVITGKEILSFA